MWPILEIAIEPKTPADREKLTVALRKLAVLDPTLHTYIDQESGQTILGGTGEGHLDQTITTVLGTYGVDAHIGAPQVAYRETIGRGAQITYAHKRQTADSSEFAEVTILFEPTKSSTGYRFSNWVDETILPGTLVAGVEKGLLEIKERGLLAGFPVIDIEACLVGAKYHDVDSTPFAFEIAARASFGQLRDEACPLLLEPIMKVEVNTPEDYVGDVIGDLNSRLGMIQGTEQRDSAHVIIAMVSLSNMFGYVNTLRFISQGRANFIMCYDHYERVAQARRPDSDPDLFSPAAAMRA